MKITQVQQNEITGKWAVIESSDENDFVSIVGDREFDTEQEGRAFLISLMESPKNGYNSIKIIGRFEERYAELVDKNYDRRSFYNGWLEGRAELLRELQNK